MSDPAARFLYLGIVMWPRKSQTRREETAKVKTPAGNLTVRGGAKQRKWVMAAIRRSPVVRNNAHAENAVGLPLAAANAKIAHDTGRCLSAAWTDE